MGNWKKDGFIISRYKRFLVVLDNEGNTLWEPYREGDYTFPSPFPTDYVPSIGEVFTIVKGREIFKATQSKGTYKVKSINSITSPHNIQINLIVEEV